MSAGGNVSLMLRERAFWRRLRGALRTTPPIRRLASEDAYRLWAGSYDTQSENWMLVLEDETFRALLSEVSLAGRTIADIGCGTGRHWGDLLGGAPLALHGVDSSREMLERLRHRHPDARLHLRAGRPLDAFDDASVDVVVSTLMLGHVRDTEGELREWARIVKPGGTVLLTEFHPDAFRSGMRRTFRHQGLTFEVEHHLDSLPALQSIVRSLGFDVVQLEERKLDERARPFFERQDQRDRYAASLGIPLVVGLRLRRVG